MNSKDEEKENKTLLHSQVKVQDSQERISAKDLLAQFAGRRKTSNYDLHPEKIKKIVQGRILFQESLAKYTTLKVGGPAEALVFPTDREDFCRILAYAESEKIPVFMLGGGSNVLVREGGIRGITICLREGLTKVEEIPRPDFAPEDTKDHHLFFQVEAGVSLPRLMRQMSWKGFSGLEGLAGVLGLVGGALAGNAGTRHGQMGDLVVSINTINRAGQRKTFLKDQLAFEYRALKLDRQWIFLDCILRLSKDDPEMTRTKVKKYLDYRQKTQPLNFPNCGSIFKNPFGQKSPSAGELIDRQGLKGVRLRGAKFSEIHANWIINLGNANANDVFQLIQMAKDQIKEAEDIVLEPEIKIVGEYGKD